MEFYKKMVPTSILSYKKCIGKYSMYLIVLSFMSFQSCSDEKMDNVNKNYYIKTISDDFKREYYQSLFVKDKHGSYVLFVKYVSSEIYYNDEKALLLSNLNIQGKNYRRLVLCNSNTIIAKDITDELALKYTGNGKFGLINEVLKIEKTIDGKIMIHYMGAGVKDDPVVEFFWE